MAAVDPTVFLAGVSNAPKPSHFSNDDHNHQVHSLSGCALCNFMTAAPLGRSAMALSYVELLRLFDTRQRTALVRLLKARGVRFMQDRRGRPITTEAEIDRALSPRSRPMGFTRPPRTTSRRAQS